MHNGEDINPASPSAVRNIGGKNSMDLQERVRWLSQQPQMLEIWRYLDQVLIDVLSEAVLIQQIPSPTFHELVRANHVLSRFGACALSDTGIDSVYNAYGLINGTDTAASAVMLSAHTDTVFANDTDLTTRTEDDGRIFGPGIGDNSLGVAALIALADVIRHFRLQTRRNVWLVANSREEGLGDLGGIRAFYASHGHELGTAIVLEGMALGRIYHSGIAVRRLHVTCHADGGHSWQHFGQPSAVHSLVRLGARLTELTPPISPRTTYNIGIIEGGHSVNSLANKAGFYLDMRSEASDSLAQFEQTVRRIIHECQDQGSVKYNIEVVGDRPAGQISREHELVQGASAALAALNVKTSYETGSTDANLLLSKGVPTVTIGLTTGGNAHRLDEFINVKPFVLGMRQLVLLALAAAEWNPQH